MAQITINTADEGKANRLLESRTITNQTTTSAVLTRGVTVPQWATQATFLINITLMGGTTPTFDFTLQGIDPWTLDTTHVWSLGDWDGITQVTTAGSTPKICIDVGANIATDDTGSATASCRYGVNATLPPVIVYNITTDGTSDDEDYTYSLSVFFR